MKVKFTRLLSGCWRYLTMALCGLLMMMSFLPDAFAQDRTVSGKVTAAEDGAPLPGVNVIVKGTSQGTVTDVEGNYNVSVPSGADTLSFSFIGYQTQDVAIGDRSTVNVRMGAGTQQLSEVVVTALGIEREQRALGYAVQEISGEAVNQGKEPNIINSLSGKISGVQVRSSNTMGGSANIMIRGANSLTGNNQPLFVVDGVPIDNTNFNSANQQRGAGGYDFGNPASDINPEDIESVSVLKGGSAAALYGNRALNGVILITTKKGKRGRGLGVSVNSSVILSQINKNTLPQHQRQYGAGYGAYFDEADIDGDGQVDQIVPTIDDASWGVEFDPGMNVVHWDALHPASPNYGEKRPWVAGANGIDAFFETGVNLVNNVAVNGGGENSAFRLSFTNDNTKGVLPNSNITRNTVAFNGSLDLSEKVTVSTSTNYVSTDVIGRYGTGYEGTNVMQSFGQWFQANVDIERLKNYQTEAGDQLAWNYASYDDLRPYYFDNPYWVRYVNYENDDRERLFGNILVEYEVTEGLKINGRSSLDNYTFNVEERIAIGSAAAGPLPSYDKNLFTFKERNDELFLNFDRRFDQNFSVNALLGTARRKTVTSQVGLGTFRGLVNRDVYAISNTVSPEINYTDNFSEKIIRSVFGNISLGYASTIFLDLTARQDWSSTLPEDNNGFFYPSVSTSFVFSELSPLADSRVLSFGKLRLNWSRVGNDTDPYNTRNYFVAESSFGANPIYRNPIRLNNPNLKPEIKEGIEAGVQLMFLNNRVELDVAVYKDNTRNQIIPVDVSRASGYNQQFINAGNIENRGIEVAMNATPVEGAFNWNIGINWARNRNKVIELAEGVDNIPLGTFFFSSINATQGEPYGTIRGTNYVFHENGQPIIDETTGHYMVTDEEEVIGNATPDWNAGITNTFTYRGISLSVLLDMQKGGDIFSLNTAFGRATGLYEETAGLNDRGNPKRDPVDEGGGVRLDGVNESGAPNQTYAPAHTWGTAWYYYNNPAAVYVFDASFVKLRELRLGYTLPGSLLGDLPVRDIKLSVVGRNLAILHKNTKHFDPEVPLSSGNAQGYESGGYPVPRTYGFNLSFNF